MNAPFTLRQSIFSIAMLLSCLTMSHAQTPSETTTPSALPIASLDAKTNSDTAPLKEVVLATQGCRSLADKAMAADLIAVNAQVKKVEAADLAKLFEQAITLWSQAVPQCDGRAKDRATRNLEDDRKILVGIVEQLDSGPQCSSAHKDAGALQEIARQSLTERRWSEAAALFRKAENMWDVASERCTGTQQDVANQHREQSEVDGYNAEFCAPLFESARESTQKLRGASSSLSREEKQDASMVTETLWHDALGKCKGSAVQDIASNNIKTIARERGTPWVARLAPAVVQISHSEVLATKQAVSTEAATPVSPSEAKAVVAAVLPSAVTTLVAMDGTQFTGLFARDADAVTVSGTGKIVWASGDVFEGSTVKGKRQGKGVITWANGQRYDGDWVSDVPTGVASVRFVNGDQYQGAVVNGIPQGKGHMQYNSGDKFDGEFKAGKPDNKGTFVWKNGQQFNGQWKNGKPDGIGKMIFASGEAYKGQFSNGLCEGEGTFTWPTGDQYIGQWKAGKKHGNGTLTWKTGERTDTVYDNDVRLTTETAAVKS
jgi:hypothetical protein